MTQRRSVGWWLTRLGLGLGLAVFAIYLGLWVALISGGGSDAADYTAFYTGWTIVLQGDGAALYDPAVQAATQREILGGRAFEAGLNPFNNPPHLVLPFVPLALLPLDLSYLVWGIVQMVLLTWLVWRLVTVVAATWTRGERLLLVGASLAATPLVVTLLQGAFSLLLAVALLEAYLALRDGRDGRAAAWLLLGTIKPQALLAPLVGLAAAGRWRLVGWLVAGGLVLAGLATVVLGPGIWSGYVSLLGGYVGSFDVMSVRPSVMWNLRGTLTLLLGPEVDAAQATLINQAAFVGQAIGLIVVGALWFRRWDPGKPAFDVRFGLTIVLGMLCSPHLNPHDVVALVPAAAIAYGGVRARTWGRWVGISLFAAPFVVLATNSISANDIGSGPIRTPVLLMVAAVVGGIVALAALRTDPVVARST